MAWLQNLAGRAEDLLNKIDQNAATVLSESNKVLERGSKQEEVLGNDENEDIANETHSNVQSNSSGLSESFCEDLQITSIKDHSYDESENNPKGDLTDAKSLSSPNSFILMEEMQNYSETISKLEIEVRELNKQLLNLQHISSELRNENTNLRLQVENSNHLAATAQSEMEQYKVRAQRILQEKENLIQLKNESKITNNTDQILTNYNEELKKEVEFQQNKNKELSEKLTKLADEVIALQQQLVLLQDSAHKSTKDLQDQLIKEKNVKVMVEEEYQTRTHELQMKIQELSVQNQLIQSKNEEIANLQQALRNKTASNVDSSLETRLKSLTDTLMVKQNALETVTTERNALRIQLEKVEVEYHNNLAQLQRSQVRVVNMNDTDDVKSQVPQFMRVSPFDAGVTRRVKHVYSTVDAISIRTGIFLRRYPVARVFVFCYMVLLQVWAFVLLFIYAPSNR